MRKFLFLLIPFLLVRIVDVEAQALQLNLPSGEQLICGEEVIIPVTVTNFTNVNTLQFQVEWDPVAFELVSFNSTSNLTLWLEDATNTPSRFMSGGVLGAPNNLADGTQVADLTLRVISENANTSDVFISDIVNLTGTDLNGDPLDIQRDTANYEFSMLCSSGITPTISCPVQTVFNIGQGETSAVINGLTPTINNDNGAVNVIYNLVFNNVTISNGEDDASGQTFNIGTTTLTYLLLNSDNDIIDQCEVGITLVEQTGVADNSILVGSTTLDAAVGMETCIDINMGAVADIANMQFAIEWDTALLELTSGSPSPALVPGAALGLTEGVNGIVTFSYIDLTLGGRDFATNDNLFTLCFAPKSNGAATLSFTDNVSGGISILQTDGAGNNTDITDQINLTAGTITIINFTEVTPPPTSTEGFSIGSGTATCGQNSPTCVGVTIGTVENLSDIQFSLNWNPTLLQYDSLVENETVLSPTTTQFGINRVGEGIFNFSWFDLGGTGQDFAADEVLFMVCFSPLANGMAPVTFSDNETQIRVNQYDASLNTVEITGDLDFTNGAIQISNCETTPPPSGSGLSLGAATANCDQTGPSCIDVTIDAFQDLSNIQFSVNWNPSILRFASATNNDDVLNPATTDYGLNRTAAGILNFSWFDLSLRGQDFAADDVLFTLCFDPVANGDGAVTFSSNETLIRVNQYNADLEQVEITENLNFNDGAIPVTNCGDGPIIGIDGISLASPAMATCTANTPACVEVLIGEIQDLANFQFSLNWDANLLEYASVANNDAILNPVSTDYGLTQVSNGILNFSWFDLTLQGQDFTANDVLFTVCFNPLRDGSADVSITDNPTSIRVNQLNAQLEQEEITDDLSFTGTTIRIDECSPMLGAVSIGGGSLDCNQANQDTCVDVTISAFQDLANFQFSINWNPSILDLTSVTNNDALLNPAATQYGQMRTDEGILNFSWFDIDFDGQDFADGDRLFTLCFTAVGVGNGDLRFSDNETPMTFNQYEAGSQNQTEITDGVDFNFSNLAIVDNQAPTVSNCPTETVVVYTTGGNCEATATWVEPTFEDACSEVSVQQTNMIGENFDLGDRRVQYTGIDGGGNIATCSFVVSVRDTIAPTVMNCPNSIIRNVSVANDCDASVTWTPPTATDACSAIPIITPDFQLGATFPFGQTVVRYTVMDNSGNINDDCAFIVEITGEAPVRLTGCPENISQSFTSESGCELSVNWTPPVLVEGCVVGEVTLTSNFEPGDQFPVGITTVTYRAVDAIGNADSCSFEVSVTGSSPIVFANCPGNIRVNSLADQCGATVGWVVPEATGGCGAINLVSDFAPNDFFPVGTTAVTYTATDANTDQETCVFTVEIIDDQSLVVICPQDIRIDANGTIVNDPLNFITSTAFEECGSIRMEYGDIRAEDNCSSSISRSLLTGLASNSLFVDTTAMSILVSNDSEESVTCDFRIIVETTPAFNASISTPLVCTGQSVTLQATDIPTAEYIWSGPNGFISNERNPVIDNPDIFNNGDYTVIARIPGGCTVSDIISLAINQGVQVEATGTDLECGGSTIELGGIGENVISWAWTGPNGYTSEEQNPIINNATSLQAGIYEVVGTGENGCTASDTVEISFAIINPPTVQAAGLLNTGVACEGQPITLKGTVYPGEPVYNWEVSNTGGGLPDEVNDSLIIAVPTNVGEFTYRYTVDLGEGCMADTSIVINVLPSPQFTATSNSPIVCATNNDQLELIGESDDANITTWSWEGPNDFASPFQNTSVREVDATLAGAYILTALSQNGCTAMDTINVEVSERPPIPSLEADRLSICLGETVSLMPDTVNPAAVYVWSGPNNFTSNDTVIDIVNASTENSGGYQLVQAIDGCESNPATIIISVLTAPVVNFDQVDNLFNVTENFSVITNDTLVSGAGFTISLIENGMRVDVIETEAGVVTNNNDGTFTYVPTLDWIGKVQVAYEICYEDCPELCSMEIVTIDTDVPSQPCLIPSVLSPNGDDRNDALIISCVSDPPKGGGITIFNQWGAVVFEAFPYNNDWKGTYQGEDLPDGVYYYVFLETDDSEPIKGFVTIFR